MPPRRYRTEKRQASAEQTRARIVHAARELLMAGGSFTGFTIDAVARQAGVARMTVYYQFRSKAGLLEALCDSLAERGQMERLAAAFGRPEPRGALEAFVGVFGHFWESDRLVIRRLRGLAALDPDFEQVIRGRDERRREGLRVLVGRLLRGRGRASPPDVEEAVNLLWTLTAFETFDALAGPTRSPEDVVPVVFRLACLVLGLEKS
jgi:AcrR family transcriptional regulator